MCWIYRLLSIALFPAYNSTRDGNRGGGWYNVNEMKNNKAAAMWQKLGSVALEEGDIAIAERCAAALGNVSRARFLRKVRQLVA